MTLSTGDTRMVAAKPVFSGYGTNDMEYLAPAELTRPFSRVGILGANETGMDIAASLLAADIPVTVFELDREVLDQATASLRSTYQEAVSDGELTASQRDRRVALLAATINLHHLKDCDVIVDTLCTSASVKDALVRRLNELDRPGAVLITCLSDADADADANAQASAEVNRIAALMRSPGNVLGMRRLNDAARGQWEIVPVKAASDSALAAATRLVQNLGMTPAVLW